jgi:hypothetical protein
MSCQKAPKRDRCHGFACPVLAISTPKKGEIAMKKIAVPLALALATGLTLTMAFASSLLPLLLT